MNKNVKKKRKGFTLIELIIVLAIMAIIAAIAIPNFTAVRDNSKNKADVQSCETIKRTVLMLVADGTVTVSADTTFSVSFNTDKSINAVTNDTTGKIREALKDIKKPQGTVGTSTTSASTYQIVITTTGNVTVTTN